MNAGNLMAAATADVSSAGAGVQKARSAAAGNRTQETSGKNSFSDTFGALQKNMDAETPKTEKRDIAFAAVQPESVPKTESSAPSQDTQDVTAKTPKNADEKQVQTESALSDAADAAALPNAAAAIFAALLSADAVPADMDANEGLDGSLAEILKRYGLTAEQLGDTNVKTALQSLLQQLPADAQKSRNFLLALSGQPLAQENMTDMGAVLQTAESVPQAMPLTELSAVLPAQIRALLNPEAAETGRPAAAEASAVPVTASGENAQTAIPTGSAAYASEQIETAQTVQENPSVSTLQAEMSPQRGRSAAELVGDALMADESSDTLSPLTVLAQRTMRHDAMQQDTTAGQGSQQEQMQTEQPVLSRSTAAPFETVVRPAETAPQSTQPAAVQTGMGALPAQEIISPDSVQEPQTRPQPDYEIPRQIVEQARLLRTLTDTQMVIRLKPEHLGELTLRVAVGSDGAVQASFHSDNAHVRNVIENSLIQLRQELNNQGIKVDRVGVYTGLADGQMPQGQGQEAWQQGSSRNDAQIYARGDADDYLDEMDGIVPSAVQEDGGTASADGVDYRV